MAEYQYLFTPLRVGPITLKNRIIFAAHATSFWEPPEFLTNERAKAYYEERAKGGVAWIILPVSSVDERADYYPVCDIPWWKDEVIPGIREIVDRVHKHDCKISAQISHPGATQWTISELSLSHPAYAPSQIGSAHLAFAIPHELEVEEILELEEKFADAAERVKKAGCDGVEIMAVHEKLLSEFHSPLLNQRTDQYGGPVENRFRFIIEIAQKVRQRVGKDFLIGVRINDSDMVPFGLDVEDSAQGAKLIEASGAVDYISLCEGMYRSGHTSIPPQYTGFEPGYRAPLTAKIKAAVKLPVFMSGLINDPGVAERLIADGVTDAVLIARGLIADPYFAEKATEGKEEDIRPCVHCNQGCVQRFITAGVSGLRCLVNPTAGEEFRWGELTRAPSRKKVLVVGAGPGGLECARTLALRSHEVVIYEKEKEVGGQVRLLCKLPGGRTEFCTFIDWLERQVEKLGVRVNLEYEINEHNLDQILDKEKPDEIVCATGARAAKDGKSGTLPMPIPGSDLPNVFTYEAVLKGAEVFGNRVVILDDFKERTAPGIAEMLAEQGKEVEIISPAFSLQDPRFAQFAELALMLEKMDKLGVKMTPYVWALGIGEAKVTCVNIFNMGHMWDVEADSVVLVTAKDSNTDIYKALKAKGIKSRLIGDAVAPRWILNAVRDGHELARGI